MSEKCPKCGSELTPGKSPTTQRCANGSVWLENGRARLVTHECTAAEITALRTELAEAKQRVAELEAGINEGRLALRSFVDDAAFVKSDSVLVDSVMDVASFLAALLPPDRITHIPGKEDDDGEMQ